MSKRIVFSTWGSYGDIHPFMALALELQARGHRPAIATLEFYREKIEAAGLKFYHLRPDTPPAGSPESDELLRRTMDLREGPRYVMRNLLSTHIRASYHDTLNAVMADGGADLLVSHAIPMAAPIVAEVTGVKWLSAVLSPISLPSVYDPPTPPEFPGFRKLLLVHPAIARGFMSLLKRMTESWIAPVRELRRELGLARSGHPMFEGQFSPGATLALFSSVLAKAQPDYPPNCVLTGFPFYDRKDEKPVDRELVQFLDNGEPPIVFTLGSAAVHVGEEFFRTSIQVARQLNRRALLLVGESSNLKSDFANGIGVFDYAPHSLVMPRASVVVHQAGIGTTGQALRAGRPMLIVPYSHDQPDNARRCFELGVAEVLPRKQYDVANAMAKIEQLLKDPSYAENARRVAGQVRDEDGTGTACDIIESVVNDVPVDEALRTESSSFTKLVYAGV
ncbi:MAG TPA: nucleotide disphospho-sugar-binding domain-containing protein [Pyrinomonadaceae bacterium]|nr:nucleotide disphospho-sugar-binding domain-containing protein [Pyrinomonadaceae bacterium]